MVSKIWGLSSAFWKNGTRIQRNDFSSSGVTKDASSKISNLHIIRFMRMEYYNGLDWVLLWNSNI